MYVRPAFRIMHVQELLPGYRANAERYIKEMINLSLRLIELLALSLDLPRDHFNFAFKSPKLPMYFLRPLHYFNQKSSDEDKIYACGAHAGKKPSSTLKPKTAQSRPSPSAAFDTFDALRRSTQAITTSGFMCDLLASIRPVK